MPTLLDEAMIVVDLYLPGSERLTCEGALRGAIPIVSNLDNGGNHLDFPLPQELTVNPFNAKK